MRIINTPSKNKKRLLVLLVFVLLIAGASGYILWQKRQSSDVADSPAPPGTIKYEPATEQEKQETERHKDQLVENQKKAEQENAGRPADGKKAVTPVITLAQYGGGNATIQAYVPNIYEEGGSCTATLKNGGKTVTKQSSAFPNATTTDCQHLTIPRADFPMAGKWTVSITYTSAISEGTSNQNTSIEVN